MEEHLRMLNSDQISAHLVLQAISVFTIVQTMLVLLLIAKMHFLTDTGRAQTLSTLEDISVTLVQLEPSMLVTLVQHGQIAQHVPLEATVKEAMLRLLVKLATSAHREVQELEVPDTHLSILVYPVQF
jgi:hypothetical protein